MCKHLFSGGSDPAAAALAQSQAQSDALLAQQQAQATQREANIRTGQKSIDDAFAQFNDNYYNNFTKAYTDAYNPDIDYQYGKAKDKLTAALAQRGVDNSSIAGNAFADVGKTYNDARSKVASDAMDASNDLRDKVSAAKTTLYGVNSQSADPSFIASQAAAQKTALTALPQSGSVGDLFGAALAPAVNYVKAAQSIGNGIFPKLPLGRSYSLF